ncbi:PIN2/TERF1-interacting telomerase inhibitor 1 [Nymphon striatum]|nr:PIN2/TERF1-interacting telomerase inhibitor 1 [Nymphon striatum]
MRIAQKWCKDHFSGFWDKNMWPSSSPVISPMDFAIWSILKSDILAKSYSSVAVLKEALLASWCTFDEEVVRILCHSVTSRLEVMAKAKGDEDKYGQKMLEKMGWSKGKGLGKNEDGIVENLKVKLKDDNTVAKNIYRHYQASVKLSVVKAIQMIIGMLIKTEFSAFLKNLNDKHKSAVPTQKKNIPNSLEMRSKLSQKRVHYQKFVRGKDTSQYSASDISSILGKRPATDCSKDISEPEISSVISKKEDNMIISSVNVNDYFKQKQQKSIIHHGNSKHDSLENINGSMNNKTSNEETIDESNEYVFQTSTNNVSDYLKQKMKDLKERTKKYVSKTRISSEDDKVNAELSQVDSAIKSTNTGVVLRCDKNKMQISKLRSRDQKIKNDYLEASSETISLKKSKKKKKKRNCHLETDTNYGLTYKNKFPKENKPNESEDTEIISGFNTIVNEKSNMGLSNLKSEHMDEEVTIIKSSAIRQLNGKKKKKKKRNFNL